MNKMRVLAVVSSGFGLVEAGAGAAPYFFEDLALGEEVLYRCHIRLDQDNGVGRMEKCV